MFLKSIFFLVLAMPAMNSVAAAECNQAEKFALKECLHEEYQKADKELNAVYSQFIAKLDAEGKESLRKAQRAWIQFRDADAAFNTERFKGGTFAGVAQLHALRDLTIQRIKDLNAQSKMGVE